MSDSDFKRSETSSSQSLSNSSSDAFSGELFVRVVPELINSGGAFCSISIENTGKGYLTSDEWKTELQALSSDAEAAANTVVIDVCVPFACPTPACRLASSYRQVRNRNEVALGHFKGAIDPFTASFSEFPSWVQKHSSELKHKKVLLYCTGGIRCEKASAYVRNQLGDCSQVFHLQGGIHKYLDAHGECQILYFAPVHRPLTLPNRVCCRC